MSPVINLLARGFHRRRFGRDPLSSYTCEFWEQS